MRIELPIVGTPAGPVGRAAPWDGVVPDQLIDSHGRRINDLRLAITDRCDLRCVYCLEPGATFAPRDHLLTRPELVRAANLCVRLGVRRIRVTGGEPTLHPELDGIISDLGRLPIDDLAMTTNGRIDDVERLRTWRRAGLTRLTISLDTLRVDRFAAVTRSKAPIDRVIAAIRAAREAGLTPVRVNAVIMRGINDDEVSDFGTFAKAEGVEVRFIEFMPLDDGRAWDPSVVVTADEMLDRLRGRVDLEPIGRERSSGTALRFRFADGSPGGVGIIAPVSRPFCGACSRLRITPDGQVRSCLFSTEEWDIRGLLRADAPDDEIIRQIADAVHHKKAGHGINTADFARPERSMSSIGG